MLRSPRYAQTFILDPQRSHALTEDHQHVRFPGTGQEETSRESRSGLTAMFTAPLQWNSYMSVGSVRPRRARKPHRPPDQDGCARSVRRDAGRFCGPAGPEKRRNRWAHSDSRIARGPRRWPGRIRPSAAAGRRPGRSGNRRHGVSRITARAESSSAGSTFPDLKTENRSADPPKPDSELARDAGGGAYRHRGDGTRITAPVASTITAAKASAAAAKARICMCDRLIG